MTRKNFIKKYAKIVSLTAQYNEIARREGILSLSDHFENLPVDNDRDIFKYGIRFAIDGTAPGIIDKILTNIINQEKDEEKRLLKFLQKEAVLMIQQGYNERIMFAILNSYTDISLAENDAILKTVDDKSLVKEEEIPDYTETGKLQIFTTMTDRDIQKILRQLDSLVLAKALKGEGKTVREAFFKNMSDRAAEMLKEDMQYMGLSVEDIEEAQDSILALVQQLSNNSEIEFAIEE